MSTSPGAGALNLNVLISAQNNASPAFLKVQKEAQELAKALEALGKGAPTPPVEKFNKELDVTGKSLREVLGPMKLFAGGLASELNPALGNVVFGAAAAARELRGLPIALAGVGIALTVATVAATAWVAALGKSIEETVKLRHQVNTLDFSGIVRDLDDLSMRMENIGEAERRGWLQGAIAKAKEFQSAIGLTPSLLEQSVRKMDALEKVFQPRMREIAAQGGLRTIEPLRQLQQMEQARAVELADEDRFIRSQQAMLPLLQEQIRLERELVQLRADAALGKERLSGVERSAILADRDQALRSLAVRERAGFAAIAESNRAGLQNIEKRTTTGPATFTPSDEDAAILGGVRFADESAFRRAAGDAGFVSAQAQALTNVVGLTRQQRVEAELVSIEAGRQLALAQAKGKLDEDQLVGLANLQVQMKQQALLQKEIAEQNPFEGFRLGIQDVVDAFTSSGQIMRDEMKNLGNDMARTLGDNFFSVVTGNFKKLSDLPAAFAQSILHAMTDVMGKLVLGNIFSNIQRGFSGGLGMMIPGLGIGGGSGGAGGLVEVGGRLFHQVAGGGGQTVLVPVSGAGAAGAGSSGFSLSNLPTPPSSFLTGGSSFFSQVSGMTFGDIANFGLSGAFAESGAVLYAGGAAARAAQLGELGINTALAGASQGISLGTAASGIGGALGLGLTIFSALQGAPTFQNIALSSASGALSGAALGASIDILSGGATFGAGTLIGAIAGAILGGGAASFGKGGDIKKTPPSERSFQAGQAGRASLSSAIDAAQTLEDLRAILNNRWSPYNEINIAAWEFGPTDSRYQGRGNRVLALVKGGGEVFFPFPDVATMLADPRYIDNLDIQVAGTAGGGSAAYDPSITKKFQDKWNGILLALAKGKFGFREDFGPLGDLISAAPSVTGFSAVERLSVLSGSQLFGRGQGQQLEVSPDVLKTQGLDADQIEQFLRVAVQVDKDRNLNILVRPEQFAF